jgi:hypothetical protein
MLRYTRGYPELLRIKKNDKSVTVFSRSTNPEIYQFFNYEVDIEEKLYIEAKKDVRNDAGRIFVIDRDQNGVEETLIFA